MSKIGSAITEIQRIEDLQRRDQWLNRIHPLVKLACTCFYIACLVSFHSYDILGVLSMGIYPLILFMTGDLSLTACLRRVRIVLPLVCLIGLFNPIFDKEPMLLFGVVVRAGVVSMLTLILKGVYAMPSAFFMFPVFSSQRPCSSIAISGFSLLRRSGSHKPTRSALPARRACILKYGDLLPDSCFSAVWIVPMTSMTA